MKLLINIVLNFSNSINCKSKYSLISKKFAFTQCKIHVLPIFLLSLSLSNVVSADCNHVSAYIANLSQDFDDGNNPNICTSLDSDSEIRACIAGQVRDNLPDDCDTRFDIFVPGTSAEHGAWKQFNRMFKTDTNSAHLVLAYDDARTVEGALNFDAALYDNGVKDARKSLILLLDALNAHFDVEQIRVFGHSKGSHSVALVADDPDYNDVEFYAFAQPGRTAVDIDPSSVIVPGRLGAPGYIEKLSDNLVGITWKNDEVQYYIGSGLSGLKMPEIWQFPGYIWQENNGGGASTNFYFYIGHHNNYGGFYTDGIESNEWIEGEGSKGNTFPYCATGDKSEAEDSTECRKQNSSKSPYFWGTPECVAESYRMMKKGETGDRYNIGYSGPRQRGSCKQSEHLMRVRWDLEYRFDLPDQNCVYTLRFGFEDLTTGLERDSFEVVGTTDNDQEDLAAHGNVFVPIHMRLKVRAKLTERDQSFSDNQCLSALESEAWIDSLKLTFDHPGTGESNKEVTIIGFDEGQGTIFNLHRWDNVAWEQPNIDSDDFRMYNNQNAIKIETEPSGITNDGDVGNFRKRVHLLD